MSENHSKRIVVWVQRFADRPYLMLQWHDPVTGKRRSESAGTADPDQAETKRADKEYELNHGLHQDVSRISWERFREVFEAEYLPGVRSLTRKKYTQVLDLFEELVHPGRLHAINERTMAAFLAGMRQRQVRGRTGLAPGTMHVYLQHLHTALSYAKEQKFLTAVPAFPQVKVPRKKPQPVPVEAFERLLARAPGEDWRALMLTAWLAGLRACEGYALCWEPTDKAPWLDFSHDRIVLPAEFAKADEDQWVPIAPELREVLEALPRQGGHVFALVGSHGRRLGLSSVCDKVNKLAQKAGVKLSLHPLRRGFGCRYAGKVPAQVLQRLMRHSSISTTMDYYANVDDAVMEAVLGEGRNRSRNSKPTAGRPGGVNEDASATTSKTCDPRT
jgi:integrase